MNSHTKKRYYYFKSVLESSYLDKLTKQEIRVCAYRLLGYTNKQVANTIFVSEKTVKVYVTRIANVILGRPVGSEENGFHFNNNIFVKVVNKLIDSGALKFPELVKVNDAEFRGENESKSG